jgi:hypothetical protein
MPLKERLIDGDVLDGNDAFAAGKIDDRCGRIRWMSLISKVVLGATGVSVSG